MRRLALAGVLVAAVIAVALSVGPGARHATAAGVKARPPAPASTIRRMAPSIVVPPSGAPCYVSSDCSVNPCVQLVGAAPQSADAVAGPVATLPATAVTPPSFPKCRRAGGPRLQTVGETVVSAELVGPVSSPARARAAHR